MDDLRSRYDAWPYPTAPVAQSRMDHLRVIGRLGGVDAQPASRCRVLELGCGDGANLIPHAAANPDSRYVGLDLSPVAVGRGQAVIDALGLDNIRLVAADIRALPKRGRFHYVVAAGVLSWVPTEVRVALFDAISEHLADDGVAYASFNAWPGWKDFAWLRKELRGLTVDQARARVEALRSGPMDAALAANLERIDAGGDAYLQHEYLAPVNDAFWFDEVATMAQWAGLHALGTPSIADAVGEELPRERARADGRAYDALLMARSSPVAVPLRDVVAASLVSGQLSEADGVFRSPAGAEIRVGSAATRAVLTTLAGSFPRAVPTAQLSGDPVVHDDLSGLIASGLLGLHAENPPAVAGVADRPTASAVARLQAREQDWVTDAWHRKMLLRPDQAQVLAAADGTRTVSQLSEDLGRDVGPTLANFAANALLVG